MNQLQMDLIKTSEKSQLKLRFTDVSAKAQSFLDECILAAEEISKNKSDVILFLENTHESLIMLEAFSEAKVKFKAAFLSCGQILSPVLVKWKEQLQSHQIETVEVRFNFENAQHRRELQDIQKRFEVLNTSILFNMWACSKLQGHVVFSGKLSLPRLSSSSGSAQFILPGPEEYALYRFSQEQNLEPFFLNSKYSLFLSQAQSHFAQTYLHLLRTERRGFSSTTFLAKTIWCEQLGLKTLKQYKLTQDQEPIWKAALRFEERDANELISRILNSTADENSAALTVDFEFQIPQDLNLTLDKPENIRLLNQLQNLSEDLTWQGAVIARSESALTKPSSGVKSFAAFPTLMQEHRFSGNLNQVKDYIEKQDFYLKTSYYSSVADLQLRPELVELYDFITQAVRRYYEDQGKVIYDFEFNKFRANKLKQNQFIKAHQQTNSLLSGLFYLNDVGGDSVFTQEMPEHSVVFISNHQVTAFNSLGVRVKPQAGRLVLYPSYLYHEVMPQPHAAEDQLMIELSLFVRDVLGDYHAGTWLDLRR